jgi:hypothetical protein
LKVFKRPLKAFFRPFTAVLSAFSRPCATKEAKERSGAKEGKEPCGSKEAKKDLLKAF